MSQKVEITRNSNFYKEFRETNPALILGLILISFGFYIINWIYVKNREFSEIDPEAPDSNRGAAILMIIPFSYFFILFVFKKLIFGYDNLYFKYVEFFGWILVIFFIMKYLFDFCITFGKITRTNGLYWFIFFIIPLFGIIPALFFNFYWFLPLVFFLFIVIPAMQAELNTFIKKFNIKKESNLFYN